MTKRTRSQPNTPQRDLGPPVERKEADADAPITGVASGGLGTASNLDDTQVMRSADLEAASAHLEGSAPSWLDDDGGAWTNDLAEEPDLPEERDPAENPEHARPAATHRRRGAAVTWPLGARTSAIAGLAAGATIVLLAGAAILGSSGGIGNAADLVQSPLVGEATFEPFATPAARPAATPESTGKGKGCRGNGRGNGCGGD